MALPQLHLPPASFARRQLLAQLLATGMASSLPFAQAQAQTKATSSKPLELVQIVDTSPTHIDVTRDFLVGSRAAWLEYNGSAAARGRAVQHTVIETDGSPAHLKTVVDSVKDLPNCVGLVGTAGARTATRVQQLLSQSKLALPHIAPWLHQALPEGIDHNFSIFASYRTQLEHALKSLATVGVPEIGAVYADAQEQDSYQPLVNRLASDLKLKVQNYAPGRSTLLQLGQQLTAQSPIILLFIGSTPELAQFARGLDAQDRMRYVIGLSDVNVQTLHQLGRFRQAAVVTTQVVPLTNANLPLVRNYRATLAKLFDEAPTPLSLAGYIAARYAQEVISGLDASANRAQVLQAFQKRAVVELGGFKVSAPGPSDSARFVTQSMLTADGRILG